MGNNKVSEKVVWEGSISPDNNPSIASQMQTQPQMMFCYKCNNVIPGNSKFCPCCKTELYTVCPKCGVKYSTQYQICNQCGTDRQEYLQLQRKEQERKAARERENRRRQETLEREKREKERQEALEKQRHEDYRKELRKTYELQKEQIINTREYQSTYSILKEALESWRRKHIMIIVLSIVLAAFIMITYKSLGDGEPVGAFAIILFLVVPWGLSLGIVVPLYRLFNTEKREKYIMQYISNKGCYYDKHILDYVVKQMENIEYTYDVLDDLSRWCIDAYGKQKRLSSFI